MILSNGLIRYFTRLSTMVFLLPLACANSGLRTSFPAATFNRSAITKIVMLGTGTPNADPNRSGPSVAIVVNEQAYLVDCGPGLVRRAAAAAIAGTKGLKPDELTHVFITHLHTDHTLGYPDLIFTPWVLERKVPLKAFGPPGLKSMTDHLHLAYEEDIRIRIDGLEPANTAGYKVEVREIEPGIIFQDENVTVRAIPVQHGSWDHAYAYRFDTPDRSIVVSGDTRPSPALIEAARGCDVLIHEVYSAERFAQRPAVWQRYHRQFHTSTTQLAEVATSVRPGLLILYHQLFWGATDEQLVAEVQRSYQEPVISARDLDVY